MRILIIGGGGREHALAWKLAQSPSVTAIYATPGNPGIASIATCIPAPLDRLTSSLSDFAALAEHHAVDLTVVGPEAPLVSGIVDQFRARGLKIVGPTATAARLEGSKLFAKEFFHRAGIPTARSGIDINKASFPVVIKADGLAAGKGVVIAHSRTEADEAIHRLSPNVVTEEFLEGEEVSFIGLSDGRHLVPFAPSQDHKRIFNSDQGPNTGGMGAYCDPCILTREQTAEIMDRIMIPAITQMGKEGHPFTGFLYAGLMMTADGPKVLEFNVRLGDPETQALLYSLEDDLADVLIESVSDAGLAQSRELHCTTPSVCVVIAAQNYPENPRTGDKISGIEEAEANDAMVFHAGTRREGDALVTSGGRVLGVTAKAASLPEAVSKVYRAVSQIRFRGMHHRADIAQKGLRRWYTAGRAGT